MQRFDERDIMFARMRYKKGSQDYEDYYKRNPSKEAIDEELRLEPGLLSPQTPMFDPVDSPLVRATFRFLGDIKQYSEGLFSANQVKVDAESITGKLKHTAKYYGADLVGVTKLQPTDYYTHRGRDSVHYGEEIGNHHKYAIVFAVQMDREMVACAPMLEQTVETTKGYVKSAIIGMILSYYIRELGYDARNHMDGNYLMPLPFLAEKAGLGEIGRLGILVTKEYGPRVRLGVVSTNLELTLDAEAYFGLKEFCMVCKKCAQVCIGRAISQDEPDDLNGSLHWQTEVEKCYRIWAKVGTDCGVCIARCPFSHNIPSDLVDQMQDNQNIMGKILKQYETS